MEQNALDIAMSGVEALEKLVTFLRENDGDSTSRSKTIKQLADAQIEVRDYEEMKADIIGKIDYANDLLKHMESDTAKMDEMISLANEQLQMKMDLLELILPSDISIADYLSTISWSAETTQAPIVPLQEDLSIMSSPSTSSLTHDNDKPTDESPYDNSASFSEKVLETTLLKSSNLRGKQWNVKKQ